ncbi:MAG: hypothetical protein Q8K26_01240 [Candidatus Gracilibacteria bacterium]|nr:hypothetical protein [Candidatus Gracilibacteria bacterium]
MLFSEEYISESDKIDRIYRMLRAERRGRIFKTIVKLSILGLIVYGYFYITDPAHEDVRTKIMDTVQTKLMELILPLVGNMVQNLTQNMQVPGQVPATSGVQHKNTPSTPAVNITPEMIKAVQDGMQK